MGQTIEATFTPTKPETIMNLVGINDANLRLIEESTMYKLPILVVRLK